MTLDEEIAALTRKTIEDHSEWDALHALFIIHRDGDGIAVRTIVGIDPAMQPAMYPVLIEMMVKQRAEEDGAPYALLLEIEAFGATAPKDDAPAWEKAKFEADRERGTIPEREDAVEAAWGWAVDVHGRTWTAVKRRGSDEVEENTYAPGSGIVGGRFAKAMLDALRLYGSEYAN